LLATAATRIKKKQEKTYGFFLDGIAREDAFTILTFSYYLPWFVLY
jgi:hypothetical protein